MTGSGEFEVDLLDGVLLARIHGQLTESMHVAVNHKIEEMALQFKVNLVLIDAIDIEPPEVEISIAQWKINEKQKSMHLTRAIVVSDTRVAYMARLAFGDVSSKIFYTDIGGAFAWLKGSQKG